MIRSMFTAISSLQLHQNYMDVIADNLANANTYGYKSNRFSFQTQYSQMLSVGSSPSDNLGGTNPLQVGLGTRMGAISPNFTQGSLQATGRNSDLAIQDEGFFIYNNGEQSYYSRDGQLELDADGNLVHGPSGMLLQGWMAAADGTIDNTGATTAITLPVGSTLAQATGTVTMGGNLEADLATTSTYPVTINAYDSLGQARPVQLTFQRTADNTWSWTASNPDTTPAYTGSGTLTFDADGQYASGSPGTVTIPGLNGSDPTTVSLDLSTLTQFATEGDVNMVNQDGLAAGDLTSFFVSSDTGEIYGVYSNGMQDLVGQLALARFVNPSGLIRSGQNMFTTGLNSGDPSIGSANTGGRGVVVSGHLEGSNVDMAQEFTNMILAQRGFQASSRVITTSDEMLQELVNIKR